MTEIAYDDLPLEPEEIKRHIVVRREAVAIMLREVSVLSESLRQKIGAPAFLMWMAAQADATNEILSDIDARVQQAQAEGDNTHAST